MEMEYMELDKSSYDSVRTEGGCSIESSAGTLVWVRRRNGHWWPGRVLAADEVPRSHLLVPKSGTPVKLLGKDDATVDWYNFGKSRRIKAFRCGEFADCIERARSFGCLRSKNREKYARRDDAILHALELEKRQADGMQSSETSLSAAAILGPPVTSNQVMPKSGCKPSYHSVRHMASGEARRYASQVPNASNAYTRLKVSGKYNSGIPRMRGLQDFGLQVAHSKGMKSRCTKRSEACYEEELFGILNEEDASHNNCQEATRIEDVNNKLESCVTRLTTGVCSTLSVSKTSLSVAQKRKKHPAGSFADEGTYKKRDRRRPLAQVLKKSSSKAAVFSCCESSVLPSSTTDCFARLCDRDATEATSSRDAYLQVGNDVRTNPSHRDLDLQQTGFFGVHGPKDDPCRRLTNSDGKRSSFWSSFWDGCQWPSLVSAHMDFDLLLGSTYGSSPCQETKCAPCIPAVAYTGSANSGNTFNANKPDASKNLQEISNFCDATATDTLHSKSSNCAGKDVQGHLTSQSMSRWQAKRRRNARKASPCLVVDIESGSLSRNKGLRKDQGPSHLQLLKVRGRPLARPVREKQLNLLVAQNDIEDTAAKTDDKKVAFRSPCFTRRKSKFSWSGNISGQGSQRVDVRIELMNESMAKFVEPASLFSEAMNRPILGYPLLVEVLRSRSGLSSECHKTKSDIVKQRTSTRVPQFLRFKLLDGVSKSELLLKASPKAGGRKPSRRSCPSRKTRMLSSLASTEFVVGKEHHGTREIQKPALPEVSKATIVTCIPVHLVFQRIREALFRHPVQLIKEGEEMAQNEVS